MSGMQEQFEIKFRLPDGTDIGPKRYPAASTVATLKETIIAQWPKGVQHFDGISQLNLNSEYINTAWEKDSARPICIDGNFCTSDITLNKMSGYA